ATILTTPARDTVPEKASEEVKPIEPVKPLYPEATLKAIKRDTAIQLKQSLFQGPPPIQPKQPLYNDIAVKIHTEGDFGIYTDTIGPKKKDVKIKEPKVAIKPVPAIDTLGMTDEQKAEWEQQQRQWEIRQDEWRRHEEEWKRQSKEEWD